MNSVIFKPSPDSVSQLPPGSHMPSGSHPPAGSTTSGSQIPFNAQTSRYQVPSNVIPETPATHYWHTLKRAFHLRRTLALSVTLVVAALLAAYALTRRPSYEVSALVYVQPMKARLVTDPGDGSYDSMRYDSYIQQQFQTVLRNDTLGDALKDAAVATPAHVWTLPGESMEAAVARLRKTLKVERETGSYQLSITLGGGDAIAVTTLVNAVVKNYIDNERADELAQNDQQLEILRKNRLDLLEQMNQSTREQAQLSSSLGVADPAGSAGSASSSASAANPYDSDLAQLRTDLEQARAARTVADAQLASVSGKADSAKSLDTAAAESYANDPGLNALKQTISERRSKLATELAGLKPKNPEYQIDQDELKRLDDSLDTMSGELRAKAGQQVLATLRLEAARREDVEARLTAELVRKTAQATGATPRLQRAAQVTAEVQRLQARFTEVDNAIDALKLEHDTSGLVHRLLDATVPSKPQTSKKWIILAGALPFGLCSGLFAAVLLYKLDPRVYIGEDIGRVLGFPPMGALPDPNEVDEQVADEFLLRLVAAIDQAHATAGARTFVFSPVSAGTGVAEMVASLAQKMDRLGYRSMILKASAALDRPAETETEEPDAWDELQLAMLPEAPPAELRRGSLIAENLEKLTQKVDLLFIEALPLLSSAEAEFAARLADVTVLVAESAKTTRRELCGVLALAQRLNVAGIATVLSAVRLRHADTDFLAMVESVEKRRFERRPREKVTVQPERERYPRNILSKPMRDQETSVKP